MPPTHKHVADALLTLGLGLIIGNVFQYMPEPMMGKGFPIIIGVAALGLSWWVLRQDEGK